MNKYLETVREIIKRNKKKIVKRISILLVLGVAVCGIGAITVYSIAKSNINYTVDEAKVIALQAVQGDILKVRKSLELDNLSFEYKFKIKNSNNMLIEVNVDSNLGVITDIDNYYD